MSGQSGASRFASSPWDTRPRAARIRSPISLSVSLAASGFFFRPTRSPRLIRLLQHVNIRRSFRGSPWLLGHFLSVTRKFSFNQEGVRRSNSESHVHTGYICGIEGVHL